MPSAKPQPSLISGLNAGPDAICIAGGGPAGLAMARACRAHGLQFQLFERHSDVGGIWDPQNHGSPVYDSAHFISSKTQSHYHDFDMPADYPDYPSHRQILAYMHGFADAFGLRPHIAFNTAITHAALGPDGWDVTTASGQTLRYGALVAATGTNWHPAMPDYPGSFNGEIRHSVTYKHAEEFRGKRVLIIGAGNSGVDIACDAARAADSACISLRRGYHFIPKHLFGIPSDQFAATGPQLPMWLEQRIFGLMLKVLNGDLTRLGLQKPDHKLFESHPIMNTQILHYLQHGDLRAKPDITALDGATVHFKDGTAAAFDLIICATGYRWQIPYLDAGLFTWRGGRPDLYMNLFSRQHDRLYALGYMETNGGAYKLFDEMADLIARTIAARAAGGTARGKIDALIAADQPDLSHGINFVNSPRHATYVEVNAYRKQTQRLRAAMGWAGLTPGCFARLRAA